MKAERDIAFGPRAHKREGREKHLARRDTNRIKNFLSLFPFVLRRAAARLEAQDIYEGFAEEPGSGEKFRASQSPARASRRGVAAPQHEREGAGRMWREHERNPREEADAPRYRRGEREMQTLRRRRQIHRLRRLLPVLIMVALGVTGFAFWRSGAADAVMASARAFATEQAVAAGLVVTEITVSGRERLSEAELKEALAVPIGTPIFSVDLAAARARLAMIGWVRNVSVARRLPNVIAIEIEERVPAALWQNEGILALVDKTGHVITTMDLAAYAHLPQVVGRGAAAAAADILPLIQAEPRLAARVRALVRVGERRWDVVFTNGVRARLPERGERAAWQRLAELESAHKVLAREIHIIDLRQPDRLVIRLTDREIKRRQEAIAERSKEGQV